MIERIIVAVVVPLIEKLFTAIIAGLAAWWQDWRRKAAMEAGKEKNAEGDALIEEGVETGDVDKILDGNEKHQEFWEGYS